jgi:transposase
MAKKRITMRQIRIILQQVIDGASIRTIVKRTGIARNTIRQYLRNFQQSGYSLEALLALDDEQLANLCPEKASGPPPDKRYEQLSRLLPQIIHELNKRHVTRQLLWEEYRAQYPGGYGYTRFCHFISMHLQQKNVVAHFTHQPGQKLLMDFAGDKLAYYDPDTGEEIRCPVFVATFPFSSFTYAEALHSQNQQDFVKAFNNSVVYFGGVSECVIFDNMTTAVKKADRYEPKFTDLAEQLSLHYQTTFMAARVNKPRDKATVEGAINIVYQRIYAMLRNQRLFSLTELNYAIKEKLALLNQRHFQGKDHSRKDLFDQYERSLLKPLPPEKFEAKKTVFAKVQKNYHVTLGEDMHHYSVPYRYTGQRIRITYTSDVVEIYDARQQRIAAHQRDYRRHAYTTLQEHMPPNHRAVYEQKGWDENYFLKRAKAIGPFTGQVVEKVLSGRFFTEQTYRSCLGILRLADKFSHQRLEKACKLALQCPQINYRLINNILNNNMDQLVEQTTLDFITPTHDNLRGEESYKDIK